VTVSPQIRRAVGWPNLQRSWLWTRTNSDRTYKRYFRDLYRAFALIDEEGLGRIRNQVLAGAYEPTHPTKLFFPKPSGIQRPFTLLTVDDQLLYQALTNLIAERLAARVSHRYNKVVFGNLYAGRNSDYFFRDWRISYKAFTRAMRVSFAQGYKYTASFDLTACYDSIDHAVLCHFLKQLRFDQEYCDLLCRLLKYWTETSGSRKPVYHGHGIPQGPPPSGLLAEVVLKYFDEADKPKEVRYFRYVDDIRLFAKTEQALRQELVKLDVRSKEIGLFPQSSKIDIHRVKRIEDEFKGISHPSEPSAFSGSSPAVIRRRVLQLTRRYFVSDTTRFKYVLGSASPSAALGLRLLRVLERQPHLYDPIFRYLAKFDLLSRALSRAITVLLTSYELYPAFTAGLIRCAQDNCHSSVRDRLYSSCRRRLSGTKSTTDPELRAVAAGLLIAHGKATWPVTKFHAQWRRSWWVRAYILPLIDESVVGPPSLTYIVNVLARDPVSDVSLVAAERLITGKLHIARPMTDINEAAQLALRRAGRIARAGNRTCPVRRAATVVLGVPVKDIQWRSFLPKKTYRALIPRMAVWRAYASSDPTAWVSLSDTVNDILVDVLFAHDPSVGKYALGNLGGVLSPSSKFAAKYPRFYAAAELLHKLRLRADLVHPITKSTKQSTRRIRFQELRQPQRVLAQGWQELWQKW
jgi:hypothetical protein